MIRKILLLPLLASTLLLSSCASLFNSEHCRTDFRSPVPRTVLIDSATIRVQPGKATPVAFVRGNQTKEAVLITDTRTDTIEVRPRWSEAYYLNFATCGVGFLFDGKTPKKWKYPSTLRLTDRYIDKHRKGADPYADYRYADKGSWNLHISLPYANAFYSAYGKESQWGAGFLGLSLGLSYHTSDKTFVNLSAAGILDFALPFPAAIDYESPQVKDHRYSILANLSNNHLLLQKRLSLGYGLSYGYDTWNTIHHGIAQEGEKQENIHRTSHSLGFVFPVYYYTRRSFYLGMVYRPMLVQFAHGAHFKYQHTISFDFGWRIRLTR